MATTITIKDKLSIHQTARSLAQKACIELGVVFLLIGVGGYVINGLQGMMTQEQLGHSHDYLRLAFGLITLAMGIAFQRVVAEKFNRWMGVFLVVFSVIGFLVGQVNAFNMNFGTTDHVLHLLAGVFLLISATGSRRSNDKAQPDSVVRP